MRTCNYRNCNASIEGKRKDCKYCSRLCKQYERVFRKREDISYKNDKKGIYDLIDKYLENEELLKNKSLVELYKSVYR